VSFETIIRGGDVRTPDGLVRQDVALRSGRIAALLPPGAETSAETVDASGLTVLPGAIDIHCHVRAPAFPERGTVESETRAAAAGGVTTRFEMPITKPCCNSPERVAIRREHFSGRSVVNFGLYAAPGRIDLAAVRALADAGVVAFKIFTTAAPPGRDDEFEGLCYPGAAEQLVVLQSIAATGLPVVVHAEDADLLAHFGAAARALDPFRASTHNAARPDICEAVAVARLLTLNITAQARLHIAHVTSAMTVDVLRRFAGTSDFSAETCPHYLSRTVEDVERAGVTGKINPPVRSAADRDALWSALADGTIRHVTTDHASFAAREKAGAAGNFLVAPPGSPGLEMLVPVMLDAVADGKIGLQRASDLLTANAADRFGLAPAKGRIVAGADADLMLVDLRATTRIDRGSLFTHARDIAQLYDGATFRGKVVRTIVGGMPVFANGAIADGPARGRFVSGRPQQQGIAA
jgi:dihydroorotase (multifunctional complex type)